MLPDSTIMFLSIVSCTSYHCRSWWHWACFCQQLHAYCLCLGLLTAVYRLFPAAAWVKATPFLLPVLVMVYGVVAYCCCLSAALFQFAALHCCRQWFSVTA